MSALVFRLLLHLCVWSRVLQTNGIPNLRYPTRFNNNQWRFGKRQDFLTKSRLFMWKPALNPVQIYSNVKKTAIPLNFNRYGIQSPPIMAPIHQGYMLAIPTKINYASYQPVKEIEEKRKPGNLHHITIINAIMPKPYLSTAPTHSHPTTTFQNYRTNNKQLYHQYFNNFGRQNMESLNKLNPQHLQLQQQQQALQLVYPSSPLALQTNKPTIEYLNVKNYNTKQHDIQYEGNEIINPVSQCGRKTRDNTNNSATDVLYYYCNNRITNYKNPTQQQLISIQPTTSTSTTTTATTTETPSIATTKSSRIDFSTFTTERPIFLPTPNARLEKSFIPITSTTTLKNSITDSGNGDNFYLQREKKYKHQRQTSTRYEDMKRQQQYTTAAAYDNVKLHSFFTIEDAVTRAPEMQVFNDPYQAYRHARRQQINHQRQTISTTKMPDTTTMKSKFKSFFGDLEDYSNAYTQGRKHQRQPISTTKIPGTMPTTIKSKFKSFFDDPDDSYSHGYRHGRKQHINHQRTTLIATKIPETTTTINKPKFQSFFDDLDDNDYIMPEAHQYDYSLFSKPQKSVYHKSEFKSEHPEHNQIIDHTRKATEENEFTPVDETFVGMPRIKEHHFGLFKSIAPTTNVLPTDTTYKTNGNLTSYSPKSITYNTTFDTVLENQKAVIEKNNNTVFLNEVDTTTTIPFATTTEGKPIGNTFNPTSSLRSSTAFKYPKQRRVYKPYKNLTATTTKATTPLKKVPKYQRQYKTKKLKQFKHLYTTTSTTTTSTTTTTIPTTVESHTTRRASVRLLPTTPATEEPKTKKAGFSRIFSTAEIPNQKNARHQSSLTTEATKRKNIKVRTTTASTVAINDSAIRVQSARRGSKRARVDKNEKETAQVTTKINKKNRRRLASSTTTAKPFISRTASGLISTSSFASTLTAGMRPSSTLATTKSTIMRISSSKSRTKLHNDIRPQKVNDDRQHYDQKVSLKSITSTVANIPPLPIEIYFEKSHNPKI